jgi:UDP-N-acetylglucosamine 2-epimerase (non-hydrolysing)
VASKKKIISVVGARPNFMKLAPVEKALRKHSRIIKHIIVHTGQHYDYNLSRIFFSDLDLPEPHIYLNAGSGSHALQTALIMSRFEKVLLRQKPDMVIVYGDVNSTLACSLACSKVKYGNFETVPCVHVESGLRSFDRTMPEEINRIVTDSLSKLLFVTEKAGADNLLKEGIDKNKIYLVGDTLIDTLKIFGKKFKHSKILSNYGLEPGAFAVVTIHRPVNTDIKKNLAHIIKILSNILSIAKNYDSDFKILFSLHPRTAKMLKTFNLSSKIVSNNGIIITKPVGYTDFIHLLGKSRFVLTDSGGIQEEATFLKIPCLTLRDSFERVQTIDMGTNTLCGMNEKLIYECVDKIFKGRYKKGKIPPLMDGKAANRIVKVIIENIFGINTKNK